MNATATSDSRLRVPPIIGFYAQVFLVTMVMFGLGGVGWGLWRPSISGTVSDGGSVELTDPAQSATNPEFSTFAVLAMLCAGLGLIVGIFAAKRARQNLGVMTMLWTSCVAWLGALVCYFLGTQLAQHLVGTPDLDTLQIGSVITYLPAIRPGIGLLLAPYTAMFGFWASAAFALTETGSHTQLAAEEPHANVSH
ncbi:hypothetical protein WG915_02150 [Corynebacterium sp. H128]|uniref:hypothetical protein n=1 Tax=unclassified Corynebacterium TaxID=2624378 RepID=UPI0030ACC304